MRRFWILDFGFWIVRGIIPIAGGMAVLLLTSLSTAETSKFLVQCHAFAAAKGNISKDYAYHLRAIGSAKEVTDGIEIDLDEKNILLSVDSKQPREAEYRTLYPNLPLALRSQQPCASEKCKQVDYEPKGSPGNLVVTYDKDNGVMLVKHSLAPKISVQSRGGCLFVGLPNGD